MKLADFVASKLNIKKFPILQVIRNSKNSLISWKVLYFSEELGVILRRRLHLLADRWSSGELVEFLSKSLAFLETHWIWFSFEHFQSFHISTVRALESMMNFLEDLKASATSLNISNGHWTNKKANVTKLFQISMNFLELLSCICENIPELLESSRMYKWLYFWEEQKIHIVFRQRLHILNIQEQRTTLELPPVADQNWNFRGCEKFHWL